MEDKDLYNDLYNENYTDVRKNELIQRVFDNKAKSLLAQKSEAFKFAEGGNVDNTSDEEEKIYTPYEFIHTLLPKVYGRPYVVSDEVGKEYEDKIKKDELELEEYTNSKLTEYGVKSLYKINNASLIEEIEIRRRKIISDKSFITESELIAYLFCHPELNTEHYVAEKPIYDVDNMIANGLIMIDYNQGSIFEPFKYVYVYEYLSGNLYKKLTRLRANKEKLIQSGKMTDEQFERQQTALVSNLPKQAKITMDEDTSLFILPKSKFSEEFRVSPEDVNDMNMYYSQSFVEAFKDWTKTDGTFDKTILKNTGNLNIVHKYFTDFELLESNADENDKKYYAEYRMKSYKDGKKLLLEFMNKGLTTNCQLRLEYQWNEIYNYYTEPKYYKIPVACQMSSKFKDNKKFTPNETQIQSIQFGRSVGSGLLAYGVGVGKTASAILNVSYALDNKLCSKPIFIVPNPTYQKWKKEMFGGVSKNYIVEYDENGSQLTLTFEDEAKAKRFAKSVNGKLKESVKKIYGHIPHRNKVVDLFNLSEDYLRNIKEYTEEEELLMKNTSELIKYLKRLPKEFNFEDESINSEIVSIYPQFTLNEVESLHNEEFNSQYRVWYNKKSNREAYGWRATEVFTNEVFKTTKLEVFTKRMILLREELPYTIGQIKIFEEGTIFFATYDALEHLGLSLHGNSLFNNDSLYGELFNEISQGDNVNDINYDSKTSLASRWKDAVFGKKKTKVDISELGIDYAVFDESHYLKKVFTDCKAIPRASGETRGRTGTVLREKRKYSFGENESTSNIALVGFFITRYIQSNNNGKNVLHLTATPFTNKPAEIYSMLSLTNGEMLRESGFNYMEEFFDVFMDISYELIFGNTGVTRKESLLGYRNLPQLRNIIYSMMDYKSGEDANIKRPEKILFPSAEKGLETTLPETEVQDELFKQIKDYQRGKINWADLCANSQEELDVDELTEEQLIEYVKDRGTDAQKQKFEEIESPLSEEDFDSLKEIVRKLSEKAVVVEEESEITSQSDKDSFRVVQGLGILKSVTLSPYLSSCQKEAGVEPTYAQYIESSPKLIYTLECIKSIHDYELQNNLRKSGVVIYMNTGVNVSFKKDGKTFKWSESGFQKIKQYLIQKMGYSNEEIAIVGGTMSNDDKERAKNSFLSGRSTVLIGSSTISTGVDLQDNASALFLCSFDWNPTDNEQISGRIHRQGNRFEKIRIVYPMVMNSADPNIFQQLYEKTLRIKNIWDRNDKGNTLDLKDFDVSALRKGILDDPEDLAKYWYEEQKDLLDTKKIMLTYRLDDLRNVRYFSDDLKTLTPVMKGVIVVIDAYRKLKNKKEAEDKLKQKLQEVDDKYEDVEDLEDKFIQIAKEKAKISKEAYDIKNDPDGRYKLLTYDEIGDDADLLKKINTTITNSDSAWNTKLEYDDKNDIHYTWLEENFPRFKSGKFNLDVPEEEDTEYTVRFDTNAVVNFANRWKGAYSGLKKVKDKLEVIGITFDEIPEAIEAINEQLAQVETESSSLSDIYPEKIAQYTAMKQERRIIQPSVQQRVDEFASYNDILHLTLTVFEEDKSKYVDVPLETLPIKPKKKIKEVIEEAVIDEPIVEKEIVSEVDTTDLIENLKNGLLVRFNLGSIKKGETLFMDLFYEDGEYIMYKAWENEVGEVIRESEKEISEDKILELYVRNYHRISEQFYGNEEEEDKPANKSKAETFKDLIEGYKLMLEIESDDAKIKLYNDLIEGYEMIIELEK